MRSLLLSLLLAGCASTPVLPPGEHIGVAIEPRAIVRYGDVGANPRAYGDQTLLVEARVVAVCQNAGCWMQIEDQGRTAMVKWFTDCGGAYAFPRDLAGKRVLIQGRCYPVAMSADEIEHRSIEAGRELEVPEDGLELNASAIVVLD